MKTSEEIARQIEDRIHGTVDPETITLDHQTLHAALVEAIEADRAQRPLELDPAPYVAHSIDHGEIRTATGYAGYRNTFTPREGYEQDEERYTGRGGM